MKKIIFEKLTVKETGHIRGALSGIFSPAMRETGECSDDYTNEPDSVCTDPAYSLDDCGGPALPHVECAASEPSVECSTQA